MPGDTKNSVPQNNTAPVQSDKVDYIGLKFNGLDDSQIYRGANETGKQVVMPDAKTAWEKYGKTGQFKDQNDFNDKYQKISNAYNVYKQYTGITKTAPAAEKEYNYLSNSIWGPQPVRVRTEQEAAWNKGKYLDKETNKWEPVSKLNFTDAINLKHDADGNPYVEKGNWTDNIKSSEKMSSLGPAPMQADFSSKIINGMYNAIVDIPKSFASIPEMVGDLSSATYNALNGKGFKSDTDINDKWHQPVYAKLSNFLKNVSNSLESNSEDQEQSMAYNITNFASSMFLFGKAGEAAGAAGKALGLGEGAEIALAKHTSSGMMGMMMAEQTLQQSDDMGIDHTWSAPIALAVGFGMGALTSKYGTNALLDFAGKARSQGILKESIQGGIDKYLKEMGLKNVEEVTTEGKSKITRYISEKLAKAVDLMNKGKTLGANVLEGGVKSGLGMGEFTLLQNAAYQVHDKLKEHYSPDAEQGEGLYFKKDSPVMGNLFNGVGDSMLFGTLSGALFAGGAWAGNRGMADEMRKRYIEKEVLQDGGAKRLHEYIDKTQWAPDDIDEQGNAIKYGEQKTNLNEAIKKQIHQHVDLINELYKNSELKDPRIVKEQLGGDKSLYEEGLRSLVDQKELKARIGVEMAKDEGKRSIDIDKWQKELGQKESDYKDIISGKRYNEKFNNEILRQEYTKGTDVMNSRATDKVVKGMSENQLKEQDDIKKRNLDSDDIRVGIQNFAQELSTYEGSLNDGFMSRLDNSVKNIERIGLGDKSALEKIKTFVSDKIKEIPELDTNNPDEGTSSAERIHALQTREKLEGYTERLEGEHKPKTEVFDRNKFVNDYQFKNHNTSGEDAKSNVERLHKIAMSGTDDEKKQLADDELTKPGGKLNKYSKDIESAKRNANSLKVYAGIDSKHTGLNTEDKLTDEQYTDIHNTANSLDNKLKDIWEASGKAGADKANAQNRLRYSRLQHSHYMLNAMSSLLKLDNDSIQALAKFEKALTDQENSKVENSKQNAYKEDLLNEAEKQQAIVESTAHKELANDKSYKKHTEIIEKLLSGLWLESYRTPIESNKNFETVFNKDFLSTRHDQLTSEQRKYKVVYTLNYLNQLTNLDSADFYRSLANVIKKMNVRFPSYEQTDIKQAIAFLNNPHNVFITEWDKIRSKNGDFDYKKEIEEPPFIDNALSMQGYAGVGKTTVVLPLVLEVYKDMTGIGDNNPTLIIGPNNEHIKSLTSSIESINKNGNLKGLTITQFTDLAKEENGKLTTPYSFIIMDEASMLDGDDVANINKLIKKENSNARVIFLLDQFQGCKEGEEFNHLPILEHTQRTMPLSINYRTDSRDVQNISDATRKSVSGGNNIDFPESHHNEDRSFGTEYFKDDTNLTDTFIEEFNKAKGGQYPWLIVKDEKKRTSLISKLSKNPDVKNTELLAQNIKTITVEDLNNTAQGRQNKKVFVLLDKGDFSGNEKNNHYARFLYTSVSRVGNGEAGKEGYAGIYVNPKQFPDAKNGKESPIASSGMTIEKEPLLKRLDYVNSAFPNKEPVKKKEPEFKKDDIVKRKNGINFIDEAGQSWDTAKILSVNPDGTVVTDHGEFKSSDLYVKEDKVIPINNVPGEYKPPVQEVVSDKDELPGIDAKFRKAAVDFEKDKTLRINSHSIADETLVELGNRLKNGDSPELTIKYIGDKDGFKNVFQLFDDKGNLLGTTHSIETSFNEDRSKRVLENFDYNKPEGVVNTIMSSFKGDKYANILQALNLARFNQHKDIIDNGGTMKVSLKSVTPGKLSFYEKGIKKPLSNLIDNSKKNLDFGNVKQATNDEGVCGMSVDVRPKGWEGNPLKVFVYTDILNKDDIKLIKEKLEESIAGSGNNYAELDQEAIHTLDLNRSTLIKNIDKVKDFLEVKGLDIAPKGERISEKYENLKKFYDYINTDAELLAQLHTWVGIKKETDGTFSLDKENPNFKRLTTHVSDILPPEASYKYESTAKENKIYFGDVVNPEKNIIPDVLSSKEEPVDKKDDSADDYVSLTKVFNNINVVNKIKQHIQNETGIPRANSLINANGGVTPFKTLAERIKDFKNNITKNVTGDASNVTSDNLLEANENDVHAYVAHNLGNDVVLNKFLTKIYPDYDIKDFNKQEAGGDSKIQQENDKHDVDKDRSSLLDNAIEGTRYREYKIDENGNLTQTRVTGNFVFGKEVIEQIKNAGAWAEKILSGQEGMTKDERFIDNLRNKAKEFTNEDGALVGKGNALQSFIDDFFKISGKPGDYSYKYIQENKADIIKQFPGLATNEDFNKHHAQVSDLMNHLYSSMTSNTQANYSFLEKVAVFGKDIWKYISKSANPVDEIKQKLKDGSDSKIAEFIGNDEKDNAKYELSYNIKKNFSGGDKSVSVNRASISVAGKKVIIVDSSNPARLKFSFDKDATDGDVKNLFYNMGINVSMNAIKAFNKNEISNKEINFTKQRLANIAGTFSFAIRNLIDKNLSNETGPGVDNILKRAGRGGISDLSKTMGGPLPSDFVTYMDNLSAAEYSSVNEAYNQRVIDVKSERIQSIRLASYITKKLSDGGKALQNSFEKLKANALSNPELTKYVNRLAKNQVVNGRLTWTKLEFVNGVKDEFTEKGNKFGNDATTRDVFNIAYQTFLNDLESGNKYKTYHILGEPRADSTTIEMLPVQIDGGKKLLDEAGWTTEGSDYINKSLADIFEHYSNEFMESRDKWKPYLQGNIPDEQWNQFNPTHIEELFNSLNDKQKNALALKLENDNNFVKQKDVRIKWSYLHRIKGTEGVRLKYSPETNEPVRRLVSLKLGHATTFNKDIDPMFNWANFEKIQRNLNGEVNELGEVIKEPMSLGSAMMEFYEPFFEKSTMGRYSLLRDIVHRNVYPLVYGDRNQYKDSKNYYKYIKESPGQTGRVGQFGQPELVNTATIPDIENRTDLQMNEVNDKVNMVNLTDGTQYIHPFYSPIFRKSFGGDMGVLGNGTMKLRTKYTDFTTGIAKDLKCATMQIKPELLDMSPVLDNILKLMTSEKLYSEFTGLRKSQGTEKAMETMANRLQNEPELHKEIIHFLQHESVVKTGQRSSNSNAKSFSDMQLDNIESEHILHQLNTDEDPDESSELHGKQLISTLAILPHNKEYIENINKAQLQKAKDTMEAINKQIGYDASKLENRDKFHSYLKDIARANTKEIGDVMMFIQAFSNPDISLDIPVLGNLAKRVFIKQINKGIKTEATGTRNVKGDSFYFKQRKGTDGNFYTLRDIAKMGAHADKLGLNTAPDEDFKDMHYEGDKMIPSATLGSYAHAKRFGILPGEDVNDVMSIKFKDGSFINTRNMSEDEAKNQIVKIWKEGGFEDVDFDNSPMFREGIKKEGTENLSPKELITKVLTMTDKELKKETDKYVSQLLNYRREFDKSLLGLSVRTPSSNPGSATPTKLSSILHTYPSVEFSNGNRNLRDDADYDIDEYTNYGYGPENIKGGAENNLILDNMLKFYGNPENKGLIFHSADLDKYTENIHESNAVGLTRALESYKINNDGKKVIGIEAIANKSYSFLYQALQNKGDLISGLKIASNGKDIYGQYVAKNISDILQMSVDNPKYGILGANGIDEESVKVLNAILLYPDKVVNGMSDKISEGFAFLSKPHIKAIYEQLKNSKSIGEAKSKLPDIIDGQLRTIGNFIEANYNKLDPNVQTPEVLDAMAKQQDLDTLQQLEILGDGFSRFHGIFKIDSKAIENSDYDRKREMSGPYGLEFILNAPADVIFGDKDKYDEFQKNNPEWYLNKSIFPVPDYEHDKTVAREREIRSLFNYKSVFDNLPLIQEYWRQHHTADTYLNDNFLEGKTKESVEEPIKKELGFNQWLGEDQSHLFDKEFNKWAQSYYYTEFHGNDIQSFGKERIAKNRYSLRTPEGRKRYSGDVLNWFKELKDSGKLQSNKLINELVVNSRNGNEAIELRGGNRYSDSVMVEMQKEMAKFKAAKTVFGTEEKPLSIYDVLHHYSTINDGFFTGGNSLTSLFGMEGMLDYSKWLETNRGKKLLTYDSKGNPVHQTFEESLETFKKDMPVQVDKELRQNDSKKNKNKWELDKNTKPDYYNSKMGVGKSRVEIVRDKNDNVILNTGDNKYGYNPAESSTTDDKIQYIPLIPKEMGERLLAGESVIYDNPNDIPLKTGMVKVGDYGDAIITRVSGGIEISLPNTGKGDAIVRSEEEGYHTPKTAMQDIYSKPIPEGKSHVEEFLKRTASKDINDDAYRNLSEHYLQSKDLLERFKNIKVELYGDTNKNDIANKHESQTGKKVNGYYRDGKIFINADSNIPKTFLHELHHAFTHKALSNPKTEKDKQFKQDIDNLYRHAKLRAAATGESFYGLKSADEFVAEGFSNPEFQRYLMSISSSDVGKSVWRKILDHIADYFGEVFGFHKGDLKRTLFNDLFASTHEYLKGDVLTDYSKPEGTYFSVENEPVDDVLKVRGKLLDAPVVSHESMSADKIREAIFKKPLNEDNYYYINNNKNEKILIPANSSHSFIDSKIKEIQELQSDFSDELKDKFSNSLNTGDFSHMGKRKDGSQWFDKDTINSIYDITGLDINSGDKVFKLSNLKKEMPELKIPDNFMGNDPLVIVHNTKFSDIVQKDIEHNPVIELSLIDFTRKGLTPGQQNLFSRYKKGGATNLTASERGVRNFQLALTAMKMREGNENIRFRKMGVMQALRDNLHYSFDVNLNPQDFLKDFNRFLKTSQGKEFLTSMPDEVQKLLSNDKLFTKDYGQDYLWMLKTEWEKQAGKPGIMTADKNKLRGNIQQLFDFMNGNREKGRDLLKQMKERQRALNRISNEDRDRDWRTEMSQLRHGIVDLETSGVTKYGTTKDISWSTLWGATESNIGHPLIDYVTTIKDRANRYIAKATLDFKESTLRKPIEKLLAQYPQAQLLNMAKEHSSEIFDKCMKKVDAVEKQYDDKGKEIGEKKIRINSKTVHHDLNDDDTKKAIANGETTREHVEFGKIVADHVWNILLDAKRHEISMNSNGFGDINKQAEDELKATWEYGMIPTMKKSSGEKWFGIDFKKFKDKITHPNVDTPDLLGDKSGEISNYFLHQLGTTKGLGNADVSGRLMGVSTDQAGNWILTDRKANEDVSTDMEQILTALKMTTLRKEKFDNDVIPAYDNARHIIAEMKLKSGIDGQFKNLEKFLDESYLAGVKQDIHHTNPESTLGKLEDKAMMLRALSGNASTAWNMGIMATIAVTNPMLAFIKSVSNKIGGSHLFHTSDLVQAAGKLATDRKLLNGIGEMYQVMAMSPRDIAGNPQKQILKKSFFKSFYMHWPVYTLDYTTREWLMAAQMIRDGKLEAHSYNKETGKVTYDEKRDRQFWNSDGSQTDKQKLMREATRQGLIKDGWMTETDTRLPKAYSLDTGERALKDISDQVIYNMGNDSHINLQNFEMGRQLYQFKPFTAGQIEQAWSQPYERLASGKMVIVKDEYGNDVAKLQPEEYEGSIHSWINAIKQLDVLAKNPKEFWMNMTPKQRNNIVALVGDVMLFSGLAMVYNKDKVEKGKKYQVAGKAVNGTRLLQSIKTSSFDLVNPYYPGFWVETLNGKNILPAVSFAVEAGKSAVNLVHGDLGKALENFPVAKSDVKIFEQAIGYNPPHKKEKQVTE